MQIKMHGQEETDNQNSHMENLGFLNIQLWLTRPPYPTGHVVALQIVLAGYCIKPKQ
jgi:hypothetical protein